MTILIKAAEIIDPNSSYNGKKRNILIENGVIWKISEINHKADRVIEGDRLVVSPGWFDMRASINDPGFEHKEDITTVARAAAAGGFTELASLPNTQPIVQSKDVIAYIKQKASHTLVDIHPMAAVSLGTKGEEMTEMIDLHHAGAVAFSDGKSTIWHSDLFLKSLQYLQTFDGVLINRPFDRQLVVGGQMNEGKTSTMLGLKGLPKVAEEVVVERDLRLLEYTGGRLHISLVSSPVSLDFIREAKKKGLNVTCDISANLLCLDDSLLSGFDTNYKVNPPLRSKEDITQFWKALNDDTIDAIVTDHSPQDEESKNLEFDLAAFGIIGLETAFALLNSTNKRLRLEKLISKISYNPREILKINHPVIEEGQAANITIFDPEAEWTFTHNHIQSRSKNTPFVGKKFKGKVVGVLNKGLNHFNN